MSIDCFRRKVTKLNDAGLIFLALELFFLILDDGLFIGIQDDLTRVTVNDNQGAVLNLRGYVFQAENGRNF